MICLDSNRNVVRNDNHIIENGLSDREFLIIDSVCEDDGRIKEYHFEDYNSTKLIYLGEYDLVYSIADLEKGVLYIAPKRTGKDRVHWITGPLLNRIEIPMLKKLLKNKGITKTNASKLIKERDNNCCQLCGETDVRTLNVHHIVPRKSPFIFKSFIDSPINQITLCANCHRIEHYVLENGDENERKEHVKKMFMINGYNWKDTLADVYYASMEDIRRYNKIEFL